MPEESPFAGLTKAKPSPFAGLPGANPFSDLPKKKNFIETFMEGAGEVFSRIGAEAQKGFETVIGEEGPGLSEEAERKIIALGLLPKKGEFLSTFNRAVIEGPVQAFEFFEATILGGLRGAAQIFVEFGGSKTVARQLMRDGLGAAINSGVIGPLVPRVPSRVATPAIVKAVKKLPQDKQVAAAKEMARKLDQGPLEQLAESQRLADPRPQVREEALEAIVGRKRPVAPATRETAPELAPPGTIKPTPELQAASAGAARSPAASLTEPRLSSALQENIVAAAEELLVSGKVTRDQSIPISAQISELLQTERITGREFVTTLERNGLTPETFAKAVWDIDISQTARDLGRLGLLSQKVGKLVEGLDAEAIASAGMTADTHAMGFWRRLDNVRRGAMVAQLSTAMRNLETQLANVAIVQPMENFLRAAILRLFTTKAFREAANKAHPLDAFEGVLNIGRRKETKAIVEEVLSRFPKLHDDLFLRFSSDIARGKGAKDLMGKAEKAMWYLNIANRFQEYLIRRAMFRAVLDKRLQAKGLGKIEDFIKDKRIGDIPKDDLRVAVATALERTWARDFSPLSPNRPEALAGSFIQLINKMPLVATIPIPFPRFMMNAMKFQFEFSPAGFIKLLSPKVRAKIAAGDVSVLSKALVGSAMFYAAWELRNSEFAGDQWWEAKDPETGKIVNLLPFNPFVVHLFVADIIKRSNEGTLGRFTAKELAFGVLSTNLRAGAGLFVLDTFLDGLVGSGNADKALENIKRLGGEVGASFAVPVQQLRDLYSEFDESQKIVRSSREDPLLGPTKRMLPGVQEQLPEVELPTRAAPPIREQPLVKQLTGLQIRAARNPVEQELIRLKFERREISPSTGNPKADRLINRALGPILEAAGSAFVTAPGYLKLKNDEKAVLLERFLKVARNAVTEELKDREPKLFAKIQISRLPRRQRQLIERKVKEQTGKSLKDLIDELGG